MLTSLPHFSSARIFGRDMKNKPCLGIRLLADGEAKLKIGNTVVDCFQANVSANTLSGLYSSTTEEVGVFLQGLIQSAKIPDNKVEYRNNKGELEGRCHEAIVLKELFAHPHPCPLVSPNPHLPENLPHTLGWDMPNEVSVLDITLWREMEDSVIERFSPLPFVRRKLEPILKETNDRFFEVSQAFWKLFHAGEPNKPDGT